MNEFEKMLIKNIKEYISNPSLIQKEKDKYIDLLVEILKTCYLNNDDEVYEPIMNYSIVEISLLYSNKIHAIRRIWQLRKELKLTFCTLKATKEYVEEVEKSLRNLGVLTE